MSEVVTLSPGFSFDNDGANGNTTGETEAFFDVVKSTDTAHKAFHRLGLLDDSAEAHGIINQAFGELRATLVEQGFNEDVTPFYSLPFSGNVHFPRLVKANDKLRVSELPGKPSSAYNPGSYISNLELWTASEDGLTSPALADMGNRIPGVLTPQQEPKAWAMLNLHDASVDIPGVTFTNKSLDEQAKCFSELKADFEEKFPGLELGIMNGFDHIIVNAQRIVEGIKAEDRTRSDGVAFARVSPLVDYPRVNYGTDNTLPSLRWTPEVQIHPNGSIAFTGGTTEASHKVGLALAVTTKKAS